jgi:hypothetical protein
MVLAAAVSALHAWVMALVAVFIACMAADIVLAEATPLVAADVIRVDAVLTLAAADETFFAAGALVCMTLAVLRVPEPATALRVALPATVLRIAGLAAALRVPVPTADLRAAVLAAALRVPVPATALLPALTFGWLAALMDTLLPVRRTRAISAEPRRVAE